MGILSQELNLQNVELNLTSIEEDLDLQLPIVIKSSFAKSLKIVIPWTSLLSLPIGVYIDNLDIEIGDKVFMFLLYDLFPLVLPDYFSRFHYTALFWICRRFSVYNVLYLPFYPPP